MALKVISPEVNEAFNLFNPISNLNNPKIQATPNKMLAKKYEVRQKKTAVPKQMAIIIGQKSAGKEIKNEWSKTPLKNPSRI